MFFPLKILPSYCLIFCSTVYVSIIPPLKILLSSCRILGRPHPNIVPSSFLTFCRPHVQSIAVLPSNILPSSFPIFYCHMSNILVLFSATVQILPSSFSIFYSPYTNVLPSCCLILGCSPIGCARYRCCRRWPPATLVAQKYNNWSQKGRRQSHNYKHKQLFAKQDHWWFFVECLHILLIHKLELIIWYCFWITCLNFKVHLHETSWYILGFSQTNPYGLLINF